MQDMSKLAIVFAILAKEMTETQQCTCVILLNWMGPARHVTVWQEGEMECKAQ